jgi:ATP-dependent Clp protease ATP-binding subunit ClpB
MIPSDALREKLRALPNRLKNRIVCQDEPINIVVERLQHAALGLASSDRPVASFLLLGPTGVGKTKLVLEFSAELFGPDRVVRLDMSEYQTQDRLALLLGSSAEEPGRLADGYNACHGVGTLLFDEIEKAHPRVLDILLQILEPGRVTTGYNRVLDFTPWVIAMTSNIGAARVMGMRRSIYETMRRLVIAEAQRELRPELFARNAEVVVFNRLDYHAQARIADGVIAGELTAQGGRGHKMVFDRAALPTVISRGYSERLGARPMRDTAERMVRGALATDLLNGGRGVGRLQAHPSGTKLELLPAATASEI